MLKNRITAVVWCCFVLVALLIAGPMPATAAEQVTPEPRLESPAPSPEGAAPESVPPAPADAAPSRVPSSFPTLGEYFGGIPSDIVGGTKAIFTRDNVPLALWGTGATLVAFTLDQSVQNYFEDHTPLKNTSIGAKIGAGYTLAAAAVGLFVAGEIIGDQKLADTGMVSAEAMVVDGVVVEVLKYATQRQRPNGGNNMSFPSGHASATATFAASVSEMYDWNLAIAVPLYAVTAFVSASRIQSGEHHFSDVVAGIALGTVIGKSFAGYTKKKRTDQRTGLQVVGIMPLVGEDYHGFAVMLKF